jgi:ATP-dependent Clp protease protease subunit
MTDDPDGLDALSHGSALETRTVLLFGEVTAAAARRVTKQLLLLRARSGEAIRLVINAPGGQWEAAEALFDVVRAAGAPVSTVGTGMVAGAAALVYAAPPRERRLSLPHARYSLFQTFESLAGLGGDVLARAQLLDLQRKRAAAIFARQTGQPEELVERDLAQRHWLSAEEARQYGLVGAISE